MDAARGNGPVREAAAGRTVVVIPTLDEEKSIAEVVRSIPRAIVSRVIVADGGSCDATAARAKAAGADAIDAGSGYGRACLAATMAAEDADIVVFMDGDGADDPGSIAKLVEPKRGESRAAHSGDSGRLSSATRRQFPRWREVSPEPFRQACASSRPSPALRARQVRGGAGTIVSASFRTYDDQIRIKWASP